MPGNKAKKDLITAAEIADEFPLHFLVWNNQAEDLNRKLPTITKDEIEKKDPRGRTPLMLAIKLNRLECVSVLLDHGANANTETDGWSAVQEATATGNNNLLRLVNERRNYQRKCDQFSGIPQLLLKLKEAPDFYVEINWEFTSWMPLVTRMCPSDTYRVYKQGAKVRVDSTLVGFEEYTWSRGNTSIIFEAHDNFGTMIELDHNRQRVYYDRRSFVAPEDASQIKEDFEALKAKLSHPLTSSYIDTEKISFERSKKGVWGWRQDRLETVNGYECKVFSASNVELVTRTRAEHLNPADKEKYRKNRNSWQSMFGLTSTEIEKDDEASQSANTECNTAVYERLSEPANDQDISLEEYFTEDYDLQGRDIGVVKDMSTKIRKFRANLWLCKDYPLSLQEQIMPIVNLMATSSSNFAKLKDFIEMQLPAGFPVKIEIPLFHVMNANVSFNNIFAAHKPVVGVTCIRDDEKLMCDIDESLFEPPSYYTFIDLRKRNLEDDDLLQFALQSNFLGDTDYERDRVDVWEALQARRPNSPNNIPEDDEERELQRAIEASLSLDYGHSASEPNNSNLPEGDAHADAPTNDLISVHREDKDLMTALSLSLKEQTERERNRKLEEEMLQEALRISINDK